jgi:rhamnogalacturonan endolyase
VGIADLNGDGAYDYLIKHPGGNVDPWVKYWEKSPETYKLEARLSTGEMLWIKDLGWNIERGTWYSPIVVADLNGDGLAEVAAKIGPETDMRDAEGKVQSGEEFVAVFNGQTGAEIARAPWPERDEFDSYNHASRNQIAVAYLDGRTPCLITLRGTYGLMLAEAWLLEDGKLKELWKFSNKEMWGATWGQGAHSCLCVDVDGDGRDEIILGSLTLDDDGSILWTTGKGHPDAHYYGDIDPKHPGMEIAYVIETRQSKEGGLNLVDAATGKFLWQLQGATRHVHSRGICSDIDPMHFGMEIYGGDADGHKLTDSRWLIAADGTIIRQGKDVDFSFGVPCAWWDADLQREMLRGRMINYDGGSASRAISGSIMQVADVIGDWREEVICTENGELRIYTTRIPALDRRECLMQDEGYRMRVTMNAMGYEQTPTLSYLPAARSLNVNLTVITENEKKYCRAVIQAALDQGYQGSVRLQPPIGIRIAESSLDVDLKPGEMLVKNFEIKK